VARLVAFYLPQFHPVPENDEWWGTGFTEWTNVAKAVPLFRGHRQPVVPADLGHYDLRSPETRAAQAALATANGVEAFCYWHYWFGGRRLLDRPFADVLASGEPDHGFCLAWANESWTRTWMGRGEILMEQTYSAADDVEHARWLTTAFADRRHLTVDGRPVFLVYRPLDHPEPARLVHTIKDEATTAGLAEPLVLGINSWSKRLDAPTIGFDGTVDFRPQLGDLPEYSVEGPTIRKLVRNLGLGVRSASLRVYDYGDAVARMSAGARRRGIRMYPCVFVGWDNSPRRGRRGIVMLNATPDRFRAALEEAIAAVADRPAEDQLVFVNAWNEWAEGNHLEPDLDTGHAALDVVRAVATSAGVALPRPERERADDAALDR
jgi:hypothetical protein